MRLLTRASVTAAVMVAVVSGVARAQTPPTSDSSATPALPPPPAPGSRLWIVVGTGFSVARAGCATCDTAGVFNKNRSLLIDAGVRVNPKVDAGIEMYFASSRVENEDPIRTTFVVAVAQLRPWHQRGFFVRAGMGIGFIGNGLYNPIRNTLAPPYSTNALGVVYGAGWIFSPYHRVAVQVHGTHHVAALGELLTTTGTSVKNVVGNYWTLGSAIVIR